MARIKIDLPETFLFQTKLTLRITEINYGGHLANDAVLGIAHEARIQFLKTMGYSEMNIEGNSLIMTDAGVVYKSQGYHGDQVKIQLSIRDISRIGFDIIYLLAHAESDKEIARVKTGMAFFDYNTNKICSTPEAVILRVNELFKAQS